MKTLYNLFFLVILLALPNIGNAQTEVAGGTLTGTTTWSLSGSPYNINGSIVVPSGTTLIIEPGVQIIIKKTSSNITVEGQLLAIGNETQNIIFTTPSSNSWQGIHIKADAANDSTILRYVTIESSYSSGINVNSTDKVEISFCIIKNNRAISGGGIVTSNCSFAITNNKFINNWATENHGGGLYCSGGNMLISNNLFNENTAGKYGGAIYTNNTAVKLINNTIVFNNADYGGAVLFHNNSDISSYNNIFWRNEASTVANIYYHTSSNGYHSNDAVENASSTIDSYSSTISYEGGSFETTCIDLKSDNTVAGGPFFKDPDSDYFLLINPSSLLVENGDTNGISTYLPTYDLEGAPRISDVTIEIGAYELDIQEVSGKVTASARGEGSINPAGDSLVYFYDSIVYTITPYVGDTLISANLDGVSIIEQLVYNGNNYSYLLDSVYEDLTLDVTFSGSYTVSASATGEGTISPIGDSIISILDTVLYTITPNSGYKLATAQYNGASIMNDLVNNGNDYTYSLSDITKDGNLEVSFANLYTVTVSASEGGSITPEGDSTVFKGSSIVYTITPNSGKGVATAQYNGTSIMNDLVNNGSDYTYTLSNITGDGNLEVSFANLYTVTASALEGGSIAPEGDSTVVEGSSIVYTITPNSGYQLATAHYNVVSIMNNLVNNGNDYTYSLTNITGNGDLDVSFAILYTVTASASEGGSITPEGDSTVIEGSSVVYTITPNSGYQVATAQYNGESVINNLVNQDSYYLYEVSNITENGTLQITFSDIPDGIDNVTKEKLNIVPNPTTGIVEIPLRSGVNKASLSIYAVTGNLVYHNPEFTGGLADLSVLQKGTYIVKINYGGTVSTTKLIKE